MCSIGRTIPAVGVGNAGAVGGTTTVGSDHGVRVGCFSAGSDGRVGTDVGFSTRIGGSSGDDEYQRPSAAEYTHRRVPSAGIVAAVPWTVPLVEKWTSMLPKWSSATLVMNGFQAFIGQVSGRWDCT